MVTALADLAAKMAIKDTIDNAAGQNLNKTKQHNNPITSLYTPKTPLISDNGVFSVR